MSYRHPSAVNAYGQRVDVKRTNRLHELLRAGMDADRAVCQVIREMGHHNR
jgi:hypothetical protein